MRLERLELNNWGAYDGPSYPVFAPNRWNCMIYGDSGSGKTTVLDAMITLMMGRKASKYNKAAGADKERDRDFNSYILGKWHGEQENDSNFQLRDENTVCNLLAVFSDSYNHVLSIAQVIYRSNNKWETMYITSDKRMSIEKDLTDYNGMSELRERLRNNGAKVHDTFANYHREMMTQMGIKNEKALDLWMKACFMKSVDSVDQFVKDNMLEPQNLYGSLTTFVNSLHSMQHSNQLLKDRLERIDLLDKVVQYGDGWRRATELGHELEEKESLIAPWVAWRKGVEAENALAACNQQLDKLNKEIESGNERLEKLQREKNEARDALIQNGGGRQEVLQKQIDDLNRELTQKMNARNRLNTKLNQAGLSAVNDKESFYQTIQMLPKMMQEMASESKRLDDEREQMAVELHQKQSLLNDVSSQVKELKKHPNTNIPTDYVALRHKICEDLKLNEMSLPFAGELMQVKQSAKSQGWEMALERLLRPFSMTLLVESSLYERVSNWVDAFKKSNKTLKIKFMKASTNMYDMADRVHDDKIRAYDCISVKEEHILANWITDHLTRRFDFVCCDSMGAFRNEKFAIMKSGLIKKKNFHEKVVYGKNQQQEQYVMGYSDKIHLAQLMEREQDLTADVDKLTAKRQKLQESKQKLENRQNIVYSIISNNRDYSALDVELVNKDLLNAENELKELEKKDPENKRLKEIVDRADRDMKALLVKIGEWNSAKGAQDALRKMYERDVSLGEEGRKAIETNGHYTKESLYDYFMDEEQQMKWEAAQKMRYESKYYVLKDNLQKKFSILEKNCEGTKKRAETNFENSAKAYIYHPVFGQDPEVQELTADVQSLDSFRGLLEQLRNNTLTDISKNREGETLEITLTHMSSAILSLSSQLRNCVKSYREKVDELNETMKTISYGEGKHIYLQYEDTKKAQYTAFKRDVDVYSNYLANITMTEVMKDEKSQKEFDDRMNEFLKKYDAHGEDSIKSKLENLTDPRNQLKFTVCIHHDKSGLDEIYHDTASQSGGEKECMAYTMIAAALNFSFNLSSTNAKEQSFRVLFIDEAFSKCSIDFVKQCMDLFDKFHLQVILLTPSDKSSNYLDFVKGAAAVASNKESHRAQLKMEYYKEETA